MLRKFVLAAAAAATFGLAGVAAVTPAEAGYWYHGTWYPVIVVPRHYHCHWEWRKYQAWRHGYPVWVKEKVKVCDDY